ncbi:MAG: DUF2202 domain-containing protein [Bacteroidia bacterium]|nr:DUF2202 domain-containing protein [Bacteroidia bacterium]
MKQAHGFLIAILVLASSCKKDNDSNLNGSNLATLDAQEQSGLIFMRQEEKLAGDVYRFYYRKWNYSIFSNISQSEDKHTNSILTLIDKYSLVDPIPNFQEGTFADTNLQKLYHELVLTGSNSLLDALIIGATIEDLDLRDLQVEMSKTTNADLLKVYNNLTKGSRNHLRTFYSDLIGRGYTYKPQFISQSEFDEIVNSPKEHGQM